jgi:hypothetical protein
MGKESIAGSRRDGSQAHDASIGPQEDCGCTAGEVGEGKARKKMK